MPPGQGADVRRQSFENQEYKIDARRRTILAMG
jgi:hypothetical protein